MSALRTPFLQKRSYRRRRVADAARLLPIAGAVLLLIPLLLPQAGSEADAAAAAAARTSSVGLYVFAVWVGLAVVAFALSFGLSETDGDMVERGGEGPGEGTGERPDDGADIGQRDEAARAPGDAGRTRQRADGAQPPDRHPARRDRAP